MGKKRGGQRPQNMSLGAQNPISLREEMTGKKQTKGGSTNVKSMLKLEHMQKLAAWAGGEASIPSLGAFFGNRLAAYGEVMGIPPDPSLICCQRCETILWPGLNCTIRIEKNRRKSSHRPKKPQSSTQNSVVYKCHFCTHWNIKRGTPKGHLKNIYPPKPKSSKQLKAAKSTESASLLETDKSSLQKKSISPEKDKQIEDEASKEDKSNQTNPSTKSGTTLLDSLKRKRNRSGSKKQAESEGRTEKVDAERTVSASSQKRRKSWTSLKEICESSERDNSRSTTNLPPIPFFL